MATHAARTLFIFIVISSGFLVSSEITGNDQQRDGTSMLRVCYYGSSKDLTPDKLDPKLCTHILFAFATLNNNSLVPKSDYDTKIYTKLVQLKKNSTLKVMLSVEGGKENGFSEMASTVENRSQFIESTLSLLVKYGFDGLDIDWEFPVFQSRPADKENLASLLHELHLAFQPTYTNQVNRLLLSVAVSAVSSIIDVAYDVRALSAHVDFVNVMCYDYHSYQLVTPLTGINSPLYHRPIERGFMAQFNINWTTTHWINLGLPTSKIIIGLPTYGHTFTLQSELYHGIGNVAVGPGAGNGSVTYGEVCAMLKNNFTRVFDDATQSPYVFHVKDWVSYDNEESIAAKASWVKEKGLGGIMTWCLNNDDWRGSCDGVTKFPLHQKIFNILNNSD